MEAVISVPNKIFADHMSILISLISVSSHIYDITLVIVRIWELITKQKLT